MSLVTKHKPVNDILSPLTEITAYFSQYYEIIIEITILIPVFWATG